MTEKNEQSSNAQRKKVLLIGWDAADWKVIHPLMDAGKMPFLQSLVNRGVMGNLSTQHPVLSPMLWTSIATGKRPYSHGVLGFTEPTPDNQSVRPVSNLSRNTKAIWNILNQNGLRSNVISWWPSHPVEKINGVMVSNQYQTAIGPVDQPWPMAMGTVHPEALRQQFADCRFHPNEVVEDQLLQFVPDAAKINQDEDKRIAGIVKILAESTSVHMAASCAMEQGDWDLTAVYYDAIDHFCHGFMKYHPPKMRHIPEQDYALFKDVVATAYRYQDMMLGGLMRQAGEHTNIIIVSDHGFHPDQNRPEEIPHQPAGPAIEHRDYGMVVMAGPDIRKDVLIHGASQLDITPTILAMMGLPVAEDMDGKVLQQVFRSAPEITTISSWDDVEGDSAMHSADLQTDPVAASEALKQLIALGYIDSPGGDQEKAVEKTANELQFNLAMSYMDGGQHINARPLLVALYEKNPQQYRFGIQLALCYRALNDVDLLDDLIERLDKQRADDAEQSKKDLIAFHELHNKTKGQSQEETKQWFKLLADEDKKVWKQLSINSNVPVFDTEYLHAFVSAAKGEHEKALEHLNVAKKSQPNRPGLHIQIANAYLNLKQYDTASKTFITALRIEPENAYAELGLARVYHCQRKARLAVKHAVKSVSLLYQNPMAHYVLGRSFAQLRKFDEAENALLIALNQNPNFREAHLRIALLYERQFNNAELAMKHRRIAKELASLSRSKIRQEEAAKHETIKLPAKLPAKRPAKRHLTRTGENSAREPLNKPFITIVSGLPRTGTSMMMQMLSSGGMPVLTDNKRVPDVDNPKGYFELQEATRLHKQSGWLLNAKGSAVKIVAQLLMHLPEDYEYRVIFMQRDLGEVLGSQSLMLHRRQKKSAAISEQRLLNVYSLQLKLTQKWLEKQHNIQTLFVNYNDVVENSDRTAEQVSDFLGGTLSVSVMSETVDPTLYRQRRVK